MVRFSKLKQIIRFSALAGLNRNNKQTSPSLLCLLPLKIRRQSLGCSYKMPPSLAEENLCSVTPYVYRVGPSQRNTSSPDPFFDI
jgi:hypothetical protein